MAYYTLRDPIVEAIQVTNDNIVEATEFCFGRYHDNASQISFLNRNGLLDFANLKDYLIKNNDKVIVLTEEEFIKNYERAWT